jgi:hypothetical protein
MSNLPDEKDTSVVNDSAPVEEQTELSRRGFAGAAALAGAGLFTTAAAFLEMFKTSRYSDISLNEWIARMPNAMAEAHLKIPVNTIRSAPQRKKDVLP